MTSTPVSLNDESLNGSWIDINSASQIHSPMDDDSAEFLMPPYSARAESVQNLGLISFQVERFLQEAQRTSQNLQQVTLDDKGGGGGAAGGGGNGGDYLLDQLSDSISLLSRASAIVSESGGLDNQQAANCKDSLWLWGWTMEPEYFTGQEWKIEASQVSQNDNMNNSNLTSRHKERFRANATTTTFTSNSQVMSWLFLTNILSIIIGAGLTYSILMRNSSI